MKKEASIKRRNGKSSIIRGLSLVLAILMLLTALPSLAFASPQSLPFDDVAGHWANQNGAIPFVFENGIMNGTSNTTFAPNTYMSRAMAVATLFRIHSGGESADANADSETPFSDVPASAWFAPYIAWAYTNNIVDGIGNNLFAPHATVNRQQFATMLHRLTDAMIDGDTAVRQGPAWNSFTDRNQIASWAVDGLMWANYHGLLTGRTATTIAPTGTITRGEVATILTRFVEWRVVQSLGDVIVSAGMFWEDWWSGRGRFSSEHIAAWEEDVPAHLAAYQRLLPTSGFESLNDIRNYLSFYYTDAWINAELSGVTNFDPFVEYNGILYVLTGRYGRIRPDWSTATHALIELTNWNRGDTVIETNVLMRSGEGDEPGTFRFTFVGGRINAGPGSWPE